MYRNTSVQESIDLQSTLFYTLLHTKYYKLYFYDLIPYQKDLEIWFISNVMTWTRIHQIRLIQCEFYRKQYIQGTNVQIHIKCLSFVIHKAVVKNATSVEAF